MANSFLRDLYCSIQIIKMSYLDKKKKVFIIQKSLEHYRKPFFIMLEEKLSQFNIELKLVFGAKSEQEDRDFMNINWAYRIHNYLIKIGSHTLYWQPCLWLLKDADLIIVEQASKLLLNYLLFIAHIAGIKKLCFWGHGKNFQSHKVSRVGEVIKNFISKRVHWWFAYNDLSVKIVKELGYPEERITSVQNAIDTKSLIEAKEKITRSALEKLKQELNIKGESICIYSGSMYPEKRLDFLIESCIYIKEKVPDFEMIFIGSGSDQDKVKLASERFEWIHYVGPKYDIDRVPYFMISKLFLMPGLVGLGILDALTMETPIITTSISYHSPEIDYLIDGFNGIIVQESNDPLIYSRQVSYILQNNENYKKLINGCIESREKYTIKEMANRFSKGIIKAINCL